MKILLLPGAFKGSLSALQAGQILMRNLRTQNTLRLFPMADGGDGFIDCFRQLDPKSRLIQTYAKNAFLKTKRTSFLLLSDHQTAIIETARICGLGTAKAHELNPLGASSYGVGQVIQCAIAHGAKRIYIGLGGVACNDGGAGMAVACGATLWDKKGSPLPLGAQSLLQLARIDLSSLRQICKGVQFWAVADVTNPLLGPKSSAKIFGPQKGATPAQVKLLDKAMSRWSRVLKQTVGKDISQVPSTAAAGAIAAGLHACFNAPLILGADFLLKKAHLDKHAKWADLLITSEGKLDAQTFYGKAPLAVLKLARKYNKPVLFICGQVDKCISRHTRAFPSLQIAQLADFAPSTEHAQKNAGTYLARVCKKLLH